MSAERATALAAELPEIGAGREDAVGAAVLLREYAVLLAHFQLQAPGCEEEIRKLRVLAASGGELPELRALFDSGRADVFFPLLAALHTQLAERDALIAHLRRPSPPPPSPPRPPPSVAQPDQRRELEAELLGLSHANDRLEAENLRVLAAAAALKREREALRAGNDRLRETFAQAQLQLSAAVERAAGLGSERTQVETELAAAELRLSELRAKFALICEERDEAVERVETLSRQAQIAADATERERIGQISAQAKQVRLLAQAEERARQLASDLSLAEEERKKAEDDQSAAELCAQRAEAALEKERTLRLIAETARAGPPPSPAPRPCPPSPAPPDLDAAFCALKEEVWAEARQQTGKLGKKMLALKEEHSSQLRAKNERVFELEARVLSLETQLASLRGQLARSEALPAELAEDNLAKQALIRRLESELRAAESRGRLGL